MDRRVALRSATLMELLYVAGCVGPQSVPFRLGEGTGRPDRAVVIFFADGMDRSRFNSLSRQGRLPNITRTFVDGGVGVNCAVASMPAITYPNAVSLITGRHPGHHGILGNQWFERDDLFLRDYGFANTYRSVNQDFTCPTVFEMLGDHFTVNVQGHTRRGVSRTIDNVASSGLRWFLGDYSDADAEVGRCVEQVAGLADREGRWPTILVSYFPGLDEVGHRFGPDSRQYAQAMIAVDSAIGCVVEAIERVRPAGERYYILVTDHGHVATRSDLVVDVVGLLRNRLGLRVHTGACQSPWSAIRRSRLVGVDAVVHVDASRRAVIHVRGPGGWQEPADLRLIERIIGIFGEAAVTRRQYDASGVGAVCVRAAGGAVNVYSRRGSATIERRLSGSLKEYRLVLHSASGRARDGQDDPFGYRHLPDLAGFDLSGWHTSHEWLAATACSAYPDFVPQIVELFDSGRAGDVVVFADFNWSMVRSGRGGHGSCLSSDMHIPLYFAGPGLPAGGRIACGRLVDVMPTVLDMLGESGRIESAEAIDGISLLARLEAAGGAFPGGTGRSPDVGESAR